MNNKPVAWMLLGLEDRKPKLINLQVIDHLEGTWIPLYTHPAKTLTDEEILNIAHQIRLIDRQTADDGHLYFARAVIKEVNGKC